MRKFHRWVSLPASAHVAGLQEQTNGELAAVKTSVGADVAVDALEVQLKDAPLKLIANAATGTIIKTESGERESFILRLHTGEVINDRSTLTCRSHHRSAERHGRPVAGEMRQVAPAR